MGSNSRSPRHHTTALEYKHRYASVSDSRHAHQRHSGNAPPEDGTQGEHTHRWELGKGPSVVGNWCVGLPPENASGRVIILQINPVPFLLRWKLEAGNWQLKVQSQLSQVREAASLEIGSRELWFCDQNGTSAVHRQSRHQKRAPYHARRRWP